MHHNIPDILPIGAGVGTASVGSAVALDLTTVSELMGIIAAGLGIVLTVCTIYWRWKEHQKRMKK